MIKQVVFIDGIGGRRYFRGPLIKFFTVLGYQVSCFDYRPARHNYARIQADLLAFLRDVASRGAFYAIAYSFGGVLLRQLLQEHVDSAIRPQKLVLLASPLKAMRLTQHLQNWRIFQWLTGDSGQLVANSEKMAAIRLPELPTLCLYGTWPWLGVAGLFLGFQQVHDGMVTADEAQPPSSIAAQAISASHAFIPQNAKALQIIADFFLNASQPTIAA